MCGMTAFNARSTEEWNTFLKLLQYIFLSHFISSNLLYLQHGLNNYDGFTN